MKVKSGDKMQKTVSCDEVEISLTHDEIDIIVLALGCCSDQIETVRRTLDSNSFYSIRDLLLEMQQMCDDLANGFSNIESEVEKNDLSNQ